MERSPDTELSRRLSGYRLPETLGFGRELAPVMFRADWRNGAWADGSLVAYEPLRIDPAATALQYAQQAFEGLKAYRAGHAEPMLFRPELNFRRLLQSSRRMCIPELPPEVFAAALGRLTTVLGGFIPRGNGQSLYLRPFVIGTGPCLAVKSSTEFAFLLIASPSDAYFASPIRVRIEREHCRAAVGGTGADKVGGNYAASLQATLESLASGFDQPLWLDPRSRNLVDELSGMNVFALIDGSLHTPRLSGSILPGVTRDSLLKLAPRLGMDVVERDMPVDELLEDIRSGLCSEVFAAGTAAIVCPISAIGDNDGSVTELPASHAVADRLRVALLDIQEGRGADDFGWMVEAGDQDRLLSRLSRI
ncbi:MAG: branched-chain amino acid aminotransferase [Lysobacterales bacterium]|jgi:branched-chain amino acid aminotransferase